MEIKEVIQASLHESWGFLTRALDGLTQEEITWTPAPHCNSLAFILWHVGRAEDLIVNRVIKGGSEIYETEGWWETFGTPPADTGGHYTEEQLRSWPTPELEDLQRYTQATHENTLAFLDTLTPEMLHQVPQPDYPWKTVGAILTHLAY